MKTELLVILMLIFTGAAFAMSPAEVVAQSKNLANSDISLLTGKQILPLSGVNPSVFDSAAFMRGSFDALSSYYTTSMMEFLSGGQNAGNPNITRKGAMVGLLNRYSAENINN
jgi:hypothetical protein